MGKDKRVLTGITTSGTPHLGNLVGAIRPAIKSSKDKSTSSFLFLADYHSLIKSQDPNLTHGSSFEIAAAWLACGLDPEVVTFYRQSDIPEILALAWILSCVTAKGLMNRAHAYKAATAQNSEQGIPELDKGIFMGLFNYPVLMAADILAFNADVVPVGNDQKQHIEMTRDIAARFNHLYGEVFTLPEALISETTGVLPGVDGQKMSKSYNNTIPIFLEEKALLKMVRKIRTNSLEPGVPKDPTNCSLFKLYESFSSEEEQLTFKNEYADGISWGDAKKKLFLLMNTKLGPIRDRYFEFQKNKNLVNDLLDMGAKKVKPIAAEMMAKIKDLVGISSII